MSLTDRFRGLVARLRGSSPVAPEPADDDAHAPGHRHLGPPPKQQAPASAKSTGARDQPWVRTSQTDSQRRRPRS